jgi:hypothetical protein
MLTETSTFLEVPLDPEGVTARQIVFTSSLLRVTL